MALRVIEFFGLSPLDITANKFVQSRRCPFVDSDCIKPNHGACSVQQITSDQPVICCPNRMYEDNYQILRDIATEVFQSSTLVTPSEVMERTRSNDLTGDEVAVFGRYWGQELPLPRPQKSSANAARKYYVDWVLAKLTPKGTVEAITAVEVQTIDTTGNYSDQVTAFFDGSRFTDSKGRTPGYSNAGMNWENVNKRILPQLIYKGHVLRREAKCSKGLFFVCPAQVYDKIRDRLGGNLHSYQPGNGTITFRSYQLSSEAEPGQYRSLAFAGAFTTTVDQIALAFTSPMNLPDQGVYESAICSALGLTN